MEKARTRFAPSPTGYMHIGNLRTALYEYLVAKKDGGTFILRIEDTDQGRIVEGAVDIIYNTMKTCGLHHDEGPDIGGEYGPYVQSERMQCGMYKEYAEKLVELGGAHYCFCDEAVLAKEREEAGEGFLYDDPCKYLSKEEIAAKIAAGEKYVIRQNIDPEGTTSFDDEVYGHIEVENSVLDEQILLKSDGFPTYNFANVIDDHLMKITHVVRGNEYLSSTPKYNLIYDAFGWQKPTYVHLPPVMKDEHHKLSKRNGDASFQDLVAKGYLPAAIMNYIALLGWSPADNEEIFTLEELAEKFDVSRISKSPSIFDIEKLTWMNGMYIRNMDAEAWYELALPYMKNAIKSDVDLHAVAAILQQRTDKLTDIEPNVDFIDELQEYDTALFVHKKMKTTEEIALKSLIHCKEMLEGLEEYNMETLHDGYIGLATKLEMKNGQIMWPARIAITGKDKTPGGAVEISNILGKEETIRRITVGIEKLQAKLG
ncbi:MAG: glutamate--tRNA ligase [Erysipelotrichaceae bacterium]|nr:glutamate--tRNA ligase [Erysipelotrichaceae bacterium]